MYAGQFGNNWHKYVQKPLPSELAVQDVARKANTQDHLIVLDIEHWRMIGTPELVEESLNKYLTVLEWFRKDALPIGYYGLPVGRDYWRGVKDVSSPEHREWMHDQIRPLAMAVDIFGIQAHLMDHLLTKIRIILGTLNFDLMVRISLGGWQIAFANLCVPFQGLTYKSV